MPGEEVLARAGELDALREPYALATVVRVDKPVSARPGDRAIVRSTGRLEGWIGGSCSEPIVVRESLAALSDATPRLVRIRPPRAAPEPAQPGVVTEVTACASEGGLDVFVEPRLPRARLVVAGSSPVARTLARLARVVGYQVDAALDEPSEQVPDADGIMGLEELSRCEMTTGDAIVVATMNRYDESALRSALATEAGYVGLVASHPRGANALELLKGVGVPANLLERVKTPAGLDLGPSTQEEIALAVLAEVVAERHRRLQEDTSAKLCAEDEVREARDPVCGMVVSITPDAVSTEHAGETWYFCGPGCRRAFVANPAAYWPPATRSQ